MRSVDFNLSSKGFEEQCQKLFADRKIQVQGQVQPLPTSEAGEKWILKWYTCQEKNPTERKQCKEAILSVVSGQVTSRVHVFQVSYLL